MDTFESALRASPDRETLDKPGITIIDVPVDYTRNTDLFAQLHDGVLE
jgi:acetolactate synthase I/II/III large subunit